MLLQYFAGFPFRFSAFLDGKKTLVFLYCLMDFGLSFGIGKSDASTVRNAVFFHLTGEPRGV